MSYIEQYFGKSPQVLSYQDIVNFFIDEREESDKLELKSYFSSEGEKEKENTILKTICAFLNSSGGIIVWGAPIGKILEGKTEKIFKGELSPVTKLYEKDSFINKIADSITPSPNSISFYRYEDNGNYIYLIEANQSEYSPHQFKNIYYMRIDGQTRPAPHHYVEALFKKITYPKLKGFIKVNGFSSIQQTQYAYFKIIILNQSKLQHEYKLFYRIVITKGRFFTYNMPNGKRNNSEISQTVPETLYYNQPFTHSEQIILDFERHDQKDYEFDITLYFGGEKSPLIKSSYTVRVSIGNLRSEIIRSEENIYMFEYSEMLGLSEDDHIKQTLERL